MIIDPINLTNILAAVAWPLFGWLAVKSICTAVTRNGEQQLEAQRLKQQHDIVQAVQEEATK